jgi:hypothetical protein
MLFKYKLPFLQLHELVRQLNTYNKKSKCCIKNGWTYDEYYTELEERCWQDIQISSPALHKTSNKEHD